MFTEHQIQTLFENEGYYTHTVTCVGPFCTRIEFEASSGFSFRELNIISERLMTKYINVVSYGCGTCGHGSRVDVKNIPMTFCKVER